MVEAPIDAVHQGVQMQMLLVDQPSDGYFLPNPAGLETAHSVDEAIDIVGRSLGPHKLKADAGATHTQASVSSLHLGDCAIVNIKYGFDVDIDAGRIDDGYLLKLTLCGKGHIRSDQRVVATSFRSVVITSPCAATAFHMSASCRHLTTRVSRRAVEERLMQKVGRRLEQPLEFDLEIASDSDFGRAWWQFAQHICEISATAPAMLSCEAVRNQYAGTLIELLLHGAPHNYSQFLRHAEPPLVPRHVRRAQEYIHEHLTQIRSVVEIATAIGVCPRTLQNGFKQALQMAPADYIRQMRVQALHRALIEADPTQSVTSVMAAVGISSFGRYARYYRQQIGVTPSVTLRRV